MPAYEKPPALRVDDYCSAPSGRMFQGVKVPNPPDSGKDIAESKGVLGNWESEGSCSANALAKRRLISTSILLVRKSQ